MKTELNVVNGLIEVTVRHGLTVEEMEKFENHELYPKIEAVAKDLQLSWSIDIIYSLPTLVTSTIASTNISEDRIAAIKQNTLNFKAAVEKMDIPECLDKTKPEDSEEDISDYDFVKTIVDTWDETDELLQTTGFVIMASSKDCPTLCIPVGSISEKLAKELCESYLKVHNND